MWAQNAWKRNEVGLTYFNTTIFAPTFKTKFLTVVLILSVLKYINFDSDNCEDGQLRPPIEIIIHCEYIIIV